MADVRPFNALHYDLGVVGSLQDVAAPPYDVIDAAQRAELLERSPYNAVAIDLPKPYSASGPRETDGDPYAEAAETIDRGRTNRAKRSGSEPMPLVKPRVVPPMIGRVVPPRQTPTAGPGHPTRSRDNQP